MVMYSFRKAGNFVQVEVGAPNNLRPQNIYGDVLLLYGRKLRSSRSVGTKHKKFFGLGPLVR